MLYQPMPIQNLHKYQYQGAKSISLTRPKTCLVIVFHLWQAVQNMDAAQQTTRRIWWRKNNRWV